MPAKSAPPAVAKPRKRAAASAREGTAVDATSETATPADMRARILDAAYGVLCEQGYDKLTQLAVCKAAAISQGHLTYYFPTRAALQLGLAEHAVYREVEQLVRQVLAGGGPPSRGGMAAAMAAKLRDRNKPRVMVGLLIAADGDARVKPAVREFIANARKMVARVLEQCGVQASEANITLLHANLIGLAMLNFALDEESFSDSIEGAVATLLHNWEKVGQDTARRTP